MRSKELKAIRKRLGFTQKEMAKVLGLASNSFACTERGETGITRGVAKLAKLAAIGLAKRPGARARMIEILRGT